MESQCQLVLSCVLSAGTLLCVISWYSVVCCQLVLMLCCVVSRYSAVCVTDGRGG